MKIYRLILRHDSPEGVPHGSLNSEKDAMNYEIMLKPTAIFLNFSNNIRQKRFRYLKKQTYFNCLSTGLTIKYTKHSWTTILIKSEECR